MLERLIAKVEIPILPRKIDDFALLAKREHVGPKDDPNSNTETRVLRCLSRMVDRFSVAPLAPFAIDLDRVIAGRYSHGSAEQQGCEGVTFVTVRLTTRVQGILEWTTTGWR